MKQANLDRLNANVTGHRIFDNVPKPGDINA
jgi:hypothetical protein